jgi:hypothetical protein
MECWVDEALFPVRTIGKTTSAGSDKDRDYERRRRRSLSEYPCLDPCRKPEFTAHSHVWYSDFVIPWVLGHFVIRISGRITSSVSPLPAQHGDLQSCLAPGLDIALTHGLS